MNNDVLVVEISGKRPGTKEQRPTEKFNIDYDKIIISNNADDYETEWDIVMVPDDYKEDYIKNYKSSDNAWYAPMNRSYAIKYAREHGYKYLIQLDDNIVMLQIAYRFKETLNSVYLNESYKCIKEYRATSNKDNTDMMNDFIAMIVNVLKNTNAGIVGCNMSGAGVPGEQFLEERYCYSLFGLNLDIVPDHYQGDFEDDIEFRYKLNQMNIPMVQICPLAYGKTAQQVNKDLTGCRKAYSEVGIHRGDHMRQLYGEYYSAGLSNRNNKAGAKIDTENQYFRHKLKPIKLGIKYKNKNEIDEMMKILLDKYAEERPDKILIKEGE